MSTSDEIPDLDSSNLDSTDEQLVAYLDNELDPAERIQVERRLAHDEAYREHLRRLQQSWDVLDLLPRSSASDGFTSTTVGLVVAQEEVLATQAVELVKQHRSRRWLVLVVGGLLAGAVGFALVFNPLAKSDRDLVRDLPVIEYVDELTNTPSVEFLEQLAAEGMFGGEPN